MPSFLQLPGGLPWWVTLAILLPLALYGLLFLAMPFSVFGVKSRLEAVEARLDEIQEEIRSLAFRLPEPSSQAPILPPAMPRAKQVNAAISDEGDLGRLQTDTAARQPGSERGQRFEPRIDWPR